jgi:hypothetical protein
VKISVNLCLRKYLKTPNEANFKNWRLTQFVFIGVNLWQRKNKNSQNKPNFPRSWRAIAVCLKKQTQTNPILIES